MNWAKAMILSVLLGIAFFSLGAVPTQQTWTGEISDGNCGLEHKEFMEGTPPLPAPECTKVCVKNGSKYVFVTEEKIFPLTNQGYADLAKFAGQSVKMAGELKGESITVSKIEPAAP